MHLGNYLQLLQRSEEALARSYRLVSAGHAADADVHYATARFARHCDAHAEALAAIAARMPPPGDTQPERFHPGSLPQHRPGPTGLLRDLLDLYQLANLVDVTWTLVGQAAQGARDRDLLGVVERCGPETAGQLSWLRMRMKATAPQTLLVAT